jgi:hypothetical protein
MLGTYASWLPGDERGLRNRAHRIHSSGDYKHPPPEHEHKGLREYNEGRAGETVEIPWQSRLRLAQIIAQLLRDAGYRVLVVSVSQCHVHFLAELPVGLIEFKRILALVEGDFLAIDEGRAARTRVGARRQTRVSPDGRSEGGHVRVPPSTAGARRAGMERRRY